MTKPIPRVGDWWEPDPESSGYFAGCDDSCCKGRVLVTAIEDDMVTFEVRLRDSFHGFDESSIEYFMESKRLLSAGVRKRSGFSSFITRIECKEVSDAS
jgi:hypothetical protein